ncbi:MAG: penicillin-insensitive murein endopeptidase [candidate division Zixibacteria bacterium]|nr:penicillin-insensitive murein endopeptidase [candidate division Zixibacteria bacterium]
MRKEIFYKLRLIFLSIICLFFCMGWICESDSIDDITDKPEDVCPYYDSDCDDISNAVENNDANDYLNLNPNVKNSNPSIAHGDPSYGYITNAINLVNNGEGYYHFLGADVMDTDDWGVLHMINMIESAGREWSDNGLFPPLIGVGDISRGDLTMQEFGGDWNPDHTSHQNGLDVDVRYLRKDDLNNSLDLSRPEQFEIYDYSATITMLNRFIFNGNIEVVAENRTID